jgi:hypothetical protein
MCMSRYWTKVHRAVGAAFPSKNKCNLSLQNEEKTPAPRAEEAQAKRCLSIQNSSHSSNRTVVLLNDLLSLDNSHQFAWENRDWGVSTA